jgi:hypothetical protein
MEEDPEYAERVRAKTLERKQKAREMKKRDIENTPLHPDARNNADRMANDRAKKREQQIADFAEQRKSKGNRVHQL